MPTVREIMTTDPVILMASATIRDAARVMRDKGIGGVNPAQRFNV